jgi:hypothetical protein
MAVADAGMVGPIFCGSLSWMMKMGVVLPDSTVEALEQSYSYSSLSISIRKAGLNDATWHMGRCGKSMEVLHSMLQRCWLLRQMSHLWPWHFETSLRAM